MSRSSLETSSSGSTPVAEPASGRTVAGRRRHMHVAAQACETCRTRKTRCDEQRPRCGLCERLDLVCVYREPKPTKGTARPRRPINQRDVFAPRKDKTQAEILHTIRRLDAKVDRILDQSPESLRQLHTVLLQLPAGPPKSQPPGKEAASPEQHPARRRADYFSESRDLRGALSIFPWPAIQTLVKRAGGDRASDFEPIMRWGSAWLVRQELLGASSPLSPEPLPRSSTLFNVTDNAGLPRTILTDLPPDLMDRYANAYFGSYNMVYPVLDRRDFMGGILPTIKAQGFSFGCLDSVIALLVFALGCAAQEGTHGRPVAQGSGIRGGNRTTPPALEFFNEARRRIGFVMSSLSLANTQAMLLMAIYFESCCRHTDFWRMAITASDALRAILRLESEWDAHGVDMIRRTFWTCSIIESWYYLDLNLPRPDGDDISDVIALPDFDDRNDFEAQPSIESKYQYSFLSMLSIRGLIYRVFEELHDPSDNGRKEGDKAHHHVIITELSRQLHTWRALLPRDLAWDDSARIDCNNSTNAPRAENDHERSPLLHVDILLAQLRCRYYYARFMIHRPFVWKVLHEPAAVVAQSPEILDGFVIAVDSMMEWPVAYPPVRDKKRLIPNMFVWTQSFLMFLLILRAVRENPEVWRFCEEKVGAERIQRSVEVMLDWIGDMRRVDGVAKWAWQTLKPIYGLAD